ADQHRALILDFGAVPFADSTAANMILALARKAARKGVRLYLSGTTPQLRRELFSQGVKPPLVRYERGIETARHKARAALASALTNLPAREGRAALFHSASVTPR